MRKKWALWSIVPIIAAIAIIVFVSRFLTWNTMGLNKFDESEYRDASFNFSQIKGWTPFEKWVASYNLGTTNLKAGAYLNAITEFERAESLAPKLKEGVDYSQTPTNSQPPFCMIRHNHSVAYEEKGNDEFDDAAKAWDGFVSSSDELKATEGTRAYKDAYEKNRAFADEAIPFYEQALESYQHSLALQEETTCRDLFSTNARVTDNADLTQNRLDQLREEPPAPPEDPQAQEPQEPEQPEQPQDPSDEPSQDPSEQPTDEPTDEPSGEPSDDPSGTDSGDSDAQDKRDELEDRNKAGDKAKEQTEGALKPGGGAGSKQW